MVYAKAARAAPSLHDLRDLQRRHHWSISSVPTVLWREDHTVLKVDMTRPCFSSCFALSALHSDSTWLTLVLHSRHSLFSWCE